MADKVHQAAEKMKGTIGEAQPSMQEKTEETKDKMQKVKPFVQEKAEEVKGRVEEQVEKVGAQSKEVVEETKEQMEKEEPMQPFEARGEDPEIDVVATEQAFFHQVKNDQEPGGGPTFSERLSQMLVAAAQMFGEIARKIDEAEEQTK